MSGESEEEIMGEDLPFCTSPLPEEYGALAGRVLPLGEEGMAAVARQGGAQGSLVRRMQVLGPDQLYSRTSKKLQSCAQESLRTPRGLEGPRQQISIFHNGIQETTGFSA